MIDEEKEETQQAEPASTEPAEAPATGELLGEDSGAVAEEAPASHAPRIILKRNGVETDSVFEINPPATIGRFDPAVGPIDVDLGPLDEGRYISRKHAKIVLEEGVWKIVDLGSANGTFMLRADFEKVDEAELADGAEFALGNARFVFRLG